MPIKAVCVLKGDVSGTVFFNQRDESSPVVLSGEVSGLKKGQHGIHIHEFGDRTADCASVGGHFNPTKMEHGSPESDVRHVGDLGNIVCKKDGGVTSVNIQDSQISLVGPNSIIGRSLVIHASPDDLGLTSNEQSKTTGSSGPAVGCGIIGIAKS